MSDPIDRIREFLKAESLEVVDIAAEIDEKYSRMKDIMRRRQRLPTEVVLKIVERYNVDANWLLTGTGRMYRMPPELIEEKLKKRSATEAGALSPRDRIWLEIGQGLSDEDRTRLQEIGAALLSARDLKDKAKDK